MSRWTRHFLGLLQRVRVENTDFFQVNTCEILSTITEFNFVAVLDVKYSILSVLIIKQVINLNLIDESNGHIETRRMESHTL